MTIIVGICACWRNEKRTAPEGGFSLFRAVCGSGREGSTFMDCAIFYVLNFLWEAICHPLESGWTTWLGILMLMLAGFLMQLLAVLHTRQRFLRLLPLVFAAVFCLYGELRWHGFFSLTEHSGSLLPTNRFSGFIFCFVGLPMLTGAVLTWIWEGVRRWKERKQEE